MGRPLADELFHPYHVIPAAELVSAFGEMSYSSESEMLVKQGARWRNVGILLPGTGDAGFQIVYALGKQNFFQMAVQCFSDALSMAIL